MSGKQFIKEENYIRYFNNGDWIDLSELPRTSKNVISWKSCSSQCINFKSGNFTGLLCVVKYNLKEKSLLFNIEGSDGTIFKRTTDDIMKCNIGKCVTKQNGFNRTKSCVAITHPI